MTTTASANVAFPDTSSVYYTTPWTNWTAGLEIIINGVYPSSRYFSLQMYDSAGSPYTYYPPGSNASQGVSSGLADFQIDPATASKVSQSAMMPCRGRMWPGKQRGLTGTPTRCSAEPMADSERSAWWQVHRPHHVRRCAGSCATALQQLG